MKQVRKQKSELPKKEESVDLEITDPEPENGVSLTKKGKMKI